MGFVAERSAFTYGHTIDVTNNYIDFDEGGGELSAIITSGSYTLGDFADEIARVMNAAGANTYSVSVDRTSRNITISADATFSLLVTTGTHTAISAFALMGFTTNRSGVATYESDGASGSYYEPQFRLQSYMAFNENKKTVDSKVNESSSGNVEVVTYGSKRLMKCEIKFASDIVAIGGKKQEAIDANATGVQDLIDFMEYITTKAPIEFVPDKTVPATFDECILESTAQSRDGVDYELRNMYAEGFLDYYKTGTLTFRKL